MKTVIRKKDNFTTIHNDLLNNDKLSWKAKGILIYMLSKPANWEYNIKGDIVKRSSDRETAVYSGVQELVKQGYVSRVKNSDGTVDYYIFEDRAENDIIDFSFIKELKPDPENQNQGNPNLENPNLENPDVLIRKNTTKERIIVILNNSKEIQEAFKEFKQMRTKIKKPLTDKAESMAIKKLEKLSGGNEEVAIQILNQSVYHCWQDLYALKEETSGTIKGGKDILTPEGLQKNIDKWGLSE